MEPRTLYLFPLGERQNPIKRKIGRAALRSIAIAFLMQATAVLYAQQWSQFPFEIYSNEVHKLHKWNDKLVIVACYKMADTLVPMPFMLWDGNQPYRGFELVNHNGGIYSFETYGDKLLIGGDFDGFSNYYVQTFTPDIYANSICVYDGDSIKPLFSAYPFNGREIKAIKYYKDDIYFGNPIELVLSPYSNQRKVINLVARWDGNEIHDCDSGLFYGIPYQLNAFEVYNDQLIAAGNFNMSRSGWTCSIAAWDGQHWHDLDTGFIDGWVKCLVVDTHNNWLYAGGNIGYAGGFDGVEVCSVAKWDGQQWSSISPPGCPSPFWYGITALEMYHGELYVSLPSNDDPNTDTLLMKYNGFEWKPILGLNSDITDLEVYNDELIVAGYFSVAGNDSCHGLARFYSPPDTTLAANRPLIEKTQWLWPPQPNPNSGKVLIPYQNPHGKTSIIQITNTEGKLLKEITCLSGKNYLELNTTQYPKGIYHITMVTDGWKKQSQKMVVE